AHHRMDRHAYPAGLGQQIVGVDLVEDLVRARLVHVKQKMPVGPGTGTTAPRLYPKTVVENLHTEIVVQILDEKTDHAQALPMRRRQYVKPLDGIEPRPDASHQLLLARPHPPDTHRLLQADAQSRFNRLQKGGSAAVLAELYLFEVHMLTPGVGVLHRPTTGIVRYL